MFKIQICDKLTLAIYSHCGSAEALYKQPCRLYKAQQPLHRARAPLMLFGFTQVLPLPFRGQLLDAHPGDGCRCVCLCRIVIVCASWQHSSCTADHIAHVAELVMGHNACRAPRTHPQIKLKPWCCRVACNQPLLFANALLILLQDS